MKLSWVVKPLGEAATVVNGGTPKSNVAEYWGGAVQWLTPKDMGQMEGREIADTPRTISKSGLENSSARLVPERSVILSTRAPIGHLAINTTSMAFNQGCRGLIPKPELNYLYLYYFLIANRSVLEKLGTGTTFKELSAGNLKSVPIPLPPLEEQQRIVAILDEAFEGLDRARAHAEANMENLEKLIGSQYDLAVSGRFCTPEPTCEFVELLLEEIDAKRRSIKGAKRFSLLDGFDDTRLLRDGWRWVPLGNLSSKISDGVHKTPSYVEQGVPFITVKNLTAGPEISFAETKFITERDHQEFIKRTHPEKGDILVSKDGTIGVVRKIESDRVFSIFVSVALVKPIDSRLSDYLTIALQAPSVQEQIVPKGAALKHFYLNDLRRLPIPIGPWDDLKRTVSRMAEVAKSLEYLQKLFAQKLRDLDDLRQSLLQKAFAGELT